MNIRKISAPATQAPNTGSPPVSKQETGRNTAPGVRAPLRVYLVEDSAHVRDLLLDFLHVPGEVEIVGYADNETESVSDILASPVDAVIVDLKLREGSGMAVIERLRKAHLSPAPKIIVFTNHPFPEIKRRAMQLGADYFFDKSADYDSVRSTLHMLRSH